LQVQAGIRDDSFNVAVFRLANLNWLLSEEIMQHFVYGLSAVRVINLYKYNQQRQKNFDHEESKNRRQAWLIILVWLPAFGSTQAASKRRQSKSTKH
jgi:hypothetical protein